MPDTCFHPSFLAAHGKQRWRTDITYLVRLCNYLSQDSSCIAIVSVISIIMVRTKLPEHAILICPIGLWIFMKINIRLTFVVSTSKINRSNQKNKNTNPSILCQFYIAFGLDFLLILIWIV